MPHEMRPGEIGELSGSDEGYYGCQASAQAAVFFPKGFPQWGKWLHKLAHELNIQLYGIMIVWNRSE